MIRLLYHDQIVAGDIPATCLTISDCWRQVGFDIYDKADLARMYDAGIPGIYKFCDGLYVMDYLGYHMERVVSV